ncbi:hypothetical protein SO802_007780 [Lithocarpus litseifolius]|uniref:Gnk2-homologous domain-containing protein n=1 Tax=Lithocarpus litseifolius TaxID=425828 RepID=A0AAW2DPZ8_9ROSI
MDGSRGTYQSNLNHLLSFLSLNSTRESGFYNTTVGQTPETTVYGLFFCRGDLTPDECRDCVSTAAKDIVEQYCPVEKVAVIWYEIYPFYNVQAVPSPSPTPTPVLLAPPNIVTTPKGKRRNALLIIVTIVAPIVVSLLVLGIGYYFLNRRAKKKYNGLPYENASNEITTVESLQYDLATIEAATNNFADDNKLGSGGFGEVYKAWKHWSNGSHLDVLDSTMRDSCSRNEVIQCIHIGLLCVQENPADRPSMASIVLMLNSNSVTLPSPQKPPFLLHSRTEPNMPSIEVKSDKSASASVQWSVNEASITEVYPR